MPAKRTHRSTEDKLFYQDVRDPLTAPNYEIIGSASHGLSLCLYGVWIRDGLCMMFANFIDFDMAEELTHCHLISGEYVGDDQPDELSISEQEGHGYGVESERAP